MLDQPAIRTTNTTQGDEEPLRSVAGAEAPFDDQRQLLYRYLALRCLDLPPFEVLRILLKEGEDPRRILQSIGHMAKGTWDRLELLVGLWLKRPGLEDLGKCALQLGIHPVSLPLYLPEMEAALPSVSKGASRSISACRMNDLVLWLADALNVMPALHGFLHGRPPGSKLTEVALTRAGSSRILKQGLKFRHSISIEGDPTLVAVPTGMEVMGSFTLKDCPSLSSVPDDLQTGRHFRLQMVPNLQKVPETLDTVGHLEISGPGRLGKLPLKIRCGGDLKLEVDLAAPGTTEDLQVAGSALIRAHNLVSLPSGTHIGGRLQLFDCPQLGSLPEGLQVHGDLMIRGCPALTSLGPGIQVGGTVHLEIPSPIWDRLKPGGHSARRVLVSHVQRRRV